MKNSFFKAMLIIGAMLLTLNLQAQQNDDKKTWANYERYAPANAQITTRPTAVFMGNSITDNWAVRLRLYCISDASRGDGKKYNNT